MNLLSKPDCDRMAQIVKEITGNRVTDKNHAMLETRMASRLRVLNLPDMEAYWNHFTKNEAAERAVLQSLLTTHHTFFFREYVHFEILAAWIGQHLPRLKERSGKSGTPVRVFSAGCSRGQEVYSLAMFLEAKLLRPHGIDYEVFGADVDPESVAYARNGVYPITEVNTIPVEFLNRHWKRGVQHLAEFAAVHPNLKKKTRFEVKNLMDAKSVEGCGEFDIIFCRNVFIYFTENDIAQMANALAARLKPEGLFVSGVSEPMRFAGWRYKSVGPSVYVAPAKENSVAAKAQTTDAAPPKSAEPRPLLADLPAKRRYSVLCVDDSSTIQLLLKKIFEADPECEMVDSAGDGNEARRKLDAKKFDVVTLDIHMPNVGGIEFLQTLYRRNEDPPVVMVSSVNRGDMDLATKSLKLGAFDYVEKPAMNSLHRSRDEILIKARMARRAAQKSGAEGGPKTLKPFGGASNFDVSISKKVVVPDASQCLRVVVGSSADLSRIEDILRGQSCEERSPAMLIGFPEGDTAGLEARLLECTERKIFILRQGDEMLKPNCVYVAYGEIAFERAIANARAQSVSLQIVGARVFDLKAFKKFPRRQTLVDEARSKQSDAFLKSIEADVDDVVPATSFASISVEFFANLRRRAA